MMQGSARALASRRERQSGGLHTQYQGISTLPPHGARRLPAVTDSFQYCGVSANQGVLDEQCHGISTLSADSPRRLPAVPDSLSFEA